LATAIACFAKLGVGVVKGQQNKRRHASTEQEWTFEMQADVQAIE